MSNKQKEKTTVTYTPTQEKPSLRMLKFIAASRLKDASETLIRIVSAPEYLPLFYIVCGSDEAIAKELIVNLYDSNATLQSAIEFFVAGNDSKKPGASEKERHSCLKKAMEGVVSDMRSTNKVLREFTTGGEFAEDAELHRKAEKFSETLGKWLTQLDASADKMLQDNFKISDIEDFIVAVENTAAV